MIYLNKILNKIDYHSNDNIDNIIITQITHNSKEVQNGALFIALSGYNTDGNKFINEAIANGAKAIISNVENQNSSVPFIRVENPRKVLSKASSIFNNTISENMTILGVTGTNGKTSITEIINFVLKQYNINCCTVGTLGLKTKHGILNTNFTTPESNQIHHYLNTMNKNNINNAILEVSLSIKHDR